MCCWDASSPLPIAGRCVAHSWSSGRPARTATARAGAAASSPIVREGSASKARCQRATAASRTSTSPSSIPRMRTSGAIRRPARREDGPDQARPYPVAVDALVRGIAPPFPGDTVRAGERGRTGKGWPCCRKRTPETNTLVLDTPVEHGWRTWDLDGHFASPVDIHAIVTERNEEPGNEVAPHMPPPLLLKGAGEDDWRPLLVGVPDSA